MIDTDPKQVKHSADTTTETLTLQSAELPKVTQSESPKENFFSTRDTLSLVINPQSDGGIQITGNGQVTSIPSFDTARDKMQGSVELSNVVRLRPIQEQAPATTVYGREGRATMFRGEMADWIQAELGLSN